jgi:predicted transposase YbfD/YdcC
MLRVSTHLNDYLEFPYVAQVFCLERRRTLIHAKHCEREVVYGVTSLTSDKADPKRLLHLSREHWCIENRSHHVRDVTFDEDRSRVRKGAGAQMMAGLRNVAISVLRMACAKNIAKSLRFLCLSPWQKVFRLLGIQV